MAQKESRLLAKYNSAVALKQRLKNESKAATTQAVRTATTMGSAFGVGYIEGRYPDKKDIFGVPVSLATGIVATIAGVMGWAGKANTDVVLSVGDGCLAAYAARRGLELGKEAQE